jgi:vacuolar-type H+-ATPase subunit H
MSPTIIDNLNEIEGLLTSGRRLPLTNNVVVNEEEVIQVVGKVREQLPDAVNDAQKLVDEQRVLLEHTQAHVRDLVANATEEAQRIEEKARERAAKLVQEHPITLEAHQVASEIIGTAQAEASNVRSQADTYALEVMTGLHEQMEKLLGSIDRGMSMLPDPNTPKGKR